MRKIIVAGLAVVVIGGVSAGVVVTKAGAQPDPQALLLTLNDLPAGPDAATPPGPPPGQGLDDPDMVLAQNGPPAPPPAAAPGTSPPPPGMPGRPWTGRGQMAGAPMAGAPMAGAPMAGAWAHRAMWHRAAMFGLFFHPEDKQLTPADVQKIAEAFLLWQGNRDWKVTQVSAGPDGKIGFAFATSDGGVIARFTMDSKTGRLDRVG